jgi:spermidine synthase
MSIGISGLIVTYELSSAHASVGVFLQSGSLGVKSLVAFAVMLPATACIGALLPVAIGFCKTPDISIPRLYAVTNVGAAAGALATGFILLPAIGYAQAVVAGAVMTLVSGAALCLVGDAIPIRSRCVQDDSMDHTSYAHRAPFLLLLILTGFGSTCLQIVAIRYFAFLLDSTIYAVSAIIAATLLGFSLGSWVLSFPTRRSLSGVQSLWMWLLLLGISILTIPGYLTLLPRLCVGAASSHDAQTSVLLIALGFPVAILVPAMLFGRVYPLVLSSGRVAYGYLCSANTLGAAAASLLTAGYLIPRLGSSRLVTGLGVAYCLSSLLFVGVAQWPRMTSVRWGFVVLAVAIGLYLPGLDYPRIRMAMQDQYKAFDNSLVVPEVLYFREGRVSNVSVVTFDGRSAWLETDGMKEARIDLSGSDVRGTTEMLLGLVPYLMSETPESALVVGYGAGTTAELLARTDVRRITIVEIEPLVVEAVQTTMPEWTMHLRDGRTSVEYGDARHFLLTHDSQYDVIASQPSHPWRLGSGNLFTREFFELARARLTPGGVFTQWLNLFHIEARTAESTIHAFYDVFPHGFVMSNPSTEDLILVGSGREMMFDLQRMSKTMSTPPLQEMLATQNILSPEDVLWYFEAGRPALGDDVEPNTDARMLTEFQLGGVYGAVTPKMTVQDTLAAPTMCDVSQYLRPSDREKWLFLLGRKLVAKQKWNDDARAWAISACLGKYDGASGDVLRDALVAKERGS